MEPTILIAISTVTLAAHSLTANYLLKGEKPFNSTSLLFVSVLPAFFISLFWFPSLSYTGSLLDIILMILKHILYAFLLFLRLQSFKELGAFGGGVLLITQPIAVAILSWIVLGEALAPVEIALAALTLSGIWIANISGSTKIYSTASVLKYLTVPTMLTASVAVIERHILLGRMTAVEFFVVDKLVMLPTFFAVYFLFVRIGGSDSRIDLRGIWDARLIGIIFVLGGFWGTSALFYGLALELQKTVWVTMIRSLAFVLVALIGSFFDDRPLGRLSLFGLGVTSLGGCLFALR